EGRCTHGHSTTRAWRKELSPCLRMRRPGWCSTRNRGSSVSVQRTTLHGSQPCDRGRVTGRSAVRIFGESYGEDSRRQWPRSANHHGSLGKPTTDGSSCWLHKQRPRRTIHFGYGWATARRGSRCRGIFLCTDTVRQCFSKVCPGAGRDLRTGTSFNSSKESGRSIRHRQRDTVRSGCFSVHRKPALGR